jgi:hypothetical protein
MLARGRWYANLHATSSSTRQHIMMDNNCQTKLQHNSMNTLNKKSVLIKPEVSNN